MDHGSQLFLLDLVMVLASLGTFILDLAITSLVVYNYIAKNDDCIGLVVVGSLFIPGLITSVLNCYWLTNENSQTRENLPPIFHVFQILTTIFLVSPMSGYVGALYYLMKRYRALSKGEVAALQRTQELMVKCLAEVTLLRLFYSFLNVCPILVLRIYQVLLVPGGNHLEGYIREGLTGFALLFSIALSLTIYDHVSQQSNSGRPFHGPSPILLLFSIHALFIGCRVIAIGAFSALSVLYAGVTLAIHSSFMVFWLLLPTLKSSFQCTKLLLILSLGVAFNFTYVSNDIIRTRYRYAFYYTVTAVSNASMMVTWFRHGVYTMAVRSELVFYTVFLGHYLLFSLGVALLTLFFKKFHSRENHVVSLRPPFCAGTIE